jgi:hypothetical protein
VWGDADTGREKLRGRWIEKKRESAVPQFENQRGQVTSETRAPKISSFFTREKIVRNEQRRATGLELASPKYWSKLDTSRILFHLPQSPAWRFFRHHGWLQSDEQRGDVFCSFGIRPSSFCTWLLESTELIICRNASSYRNSFASGRIYLLTDIVSCLV